MSSEIKDLTTYHYYCTDNLEDEDDATSFAIDFWTDDLEDIAQEAAEKEWYYHNGNEWMQDGVEELVLLDSEKKEIGRFKISSEPVMFFSAFQTSAKGERK